MRTPGRAKQRMTRPTAAPEPVNCSTNQSKAMTVNWSPRYEMLSPSQSRWNAGWRNGSARCGRSVTASPFILPFSLDAAALARPARPGHESWRDREQQLYGRKVGRVASCVARQYRYPRDSSVRTDEEVGKTIRPGAAGLAISKKRPAREKQGRPRNLEQPQTEAYDGVDHPERLCTHHFAFRLSEWATDSGDPGTSGTSECQQFSRVLARRHQLARQGSCRFSAHTRSAPVDRSVSARACSPARWAIRHLRSLGFNRRGQACEDQGHRDALTEAP